MPASFVVADRRTPVSVWVRAMLAPMITAPEGSVTVPDTVPRLVWPWAATARAMTATNKKTELGFISRVPGPPQYNTRPESASVGTIRMRIQWALGDHKTTIYGYELGVILLHHIENTPKA